MDEKNDKQEEEVLSKGKNIEKEDVEKYKILYEHCKSVSEQETARGDVLEGKASKLVVFYNIIILFLFTIGKLLLTSKSLIRISLWELLALISLAFILYQVSKGTYFVIKVFKLRSLEIPAIKESHINFFEKSKNNILHFYKRNLKSFLCIFEKSLENNEKKAKNLEIGYKCLEKSYVGILIFVVSILIGYFSRVFILI